jgi:hypothetical protein
VTEGLVPGRSLSFPLTSESGKVDAVDLAEPVRLCAGYMYPVRCFVKKGRE